MLTSCPQQKPLSQTITGKRGYVLDQSQVHDVCKPAGGQQPSQGSQEPPDRVPGQCPLWKGQGHLVPPARVEWGLGVRSARPPRTAAGSGQPGAGGRKAGAESPQVSRAPPGVRRHTRPQRGSADSLSRARSLRTRGWNRAHRSAPPHAVGARGPLPPGSQAPAPAQPSRGTAHRAAAGAASRRVPMRVPAPHNTHPTPSLARLPRGGSGRGGEVLAGRWLRASNTCGQARLSRGGAATPASPAPPCGPGWASPRPRWTAWRRGSRAQRRRLTTGSGGWDPDPRPPSPQRPVGPLRAVPHPHVQLPLSRFTC
nr:basic proline-rich protein-like [Vicugna pacos]